MGIGSGGREQMNLSLLPKAAMSSPDPRYGQRRENPKQQQCPLVPAGLSPGWFGQYVWASVSGRGLCRVPDVSLTAQLSMTLSGWRNKRGTLFLPGDAGEKLEASNLYSGKHVMESS